MSYLANKIVAVVVVSKINGMRISFSYEQIINFALYPISTLSDVIVAHEDLNPFITHKQHIKYI